MRRISRNPVPPALTTWRQQRQDDPNFGYDLMPANLRTSVLLSLVSEQRGLCAYTGVRITRMSSHIEHLFPQQHCTVDEQTRYENLAACTPAPNSGRLSYGAHEKDNWPGEAERSMFVTPYSEGCESRFSFNLRGKISATDSADEPAKETIRQLRLDHPGLTARRKAAIQASLGLGRTRKLRVDAKVARNSLSRLARQEDEAAQLDEFSFVLKQAIPKHLERLETIRKAKRAKKK